MTALIVVGIDIGGTKIKAGAVRLNREALAEPQVVTASQISTPRLPPSAFYDHVAALVRTLQSQLNDISESVLPLVAVAQPGRFHPDGTLARGTTPNLGERPGQFDGIAPSQELERRLGMSVVAENDAIAQMRFALHALLRDAAARSRLINHTIVYLGPGTGMGGGVARVDAQGAVRPITDGHLFDLQLPTYGDGTLTAEEVFTGPAIARMVEAANARLDDPIQPANAEWLGRVLGDPHAPAAQRRAAEDITQEIGDILAQLIATIHAGRIVKVRLEALADGRVRRHVDEPDRAWPAADQAAVRGVTRFVLGGSVGVNPVLGGTVRAQALARVAQQRLRDIEILQSPVPSADAGLLGAVLAIPDELLRPPSTVDGPP